MKSKVAKFLVDESILLLVATTTDVRLVVVAKGDSHNLKVQESETQPKVFSTDPAVRVSSVVELRKTGRVFLGLTNG